MTTNDFSSPRYIKLKPYSTKEMAEMYGVCTNTFRKWIAPYQDEIGPRVGRFYSVKQVRVIFKVLSYPSMLDPDKEQ